MWVWKSRGLLEIGLGSVFGVPAALLDVKELTRGSPGLWGNGFLHSGYHVECLLYMTHIQSSKGSRSLNTPYSILFSIEEDKDR